MLTRKARFISKVTLKGEKFNFHLGNFAVLSAEPIRLRTLASDFTDACWSRRSLFG